MEEIVGSLAGVSGHTFDTVYDLIFTTERVIAVLIKHPMDVPYKPKFMEAFLGGKLANFDERHMRERIAQERRSSLAGALDELVTSHHLNSEIRYDAVTSVEVPSGLFKSQLKFNVSGTATAGKRTNFTLRKKQIPEARRLLNLVLPSNVKTE